MKNKFFVILAGVLLSANITSAQTVTLPQVAVENNLVSHANAMIMPTTSGSNCQFGFWTGDSDTSWTAVQVLQPASFFQNVSITLPDSVVCDISWNGMFKVWSGTNPPVYSSVVNWDFPCPTWPTLGIPTIEILSGDSLGWVVMSVPYDTGGALADLFFHVTISELTPFFIEVEDIFGTGVWTFTSFVGVGNSVIFENFQLINIEGLYSLQGGVGATVPAPVPTPMVVSMETELNDNTLSVDILVTESGWNTSSLTLIVKYLDCDGNWEDYSTTTFSYLDYVYDQTESYSTIIFPSLEWKIILETTNGTYDLGLTESQIVPQVEIEEIDISYVGDGWWEVEVYLQNEIPGTIFSAMIGNNVVSSGTADIFQFNQNPFEEFELEVFANGPMSCDYSEIMEVILQICEPPTHNLEAAYQITQTEAIVPLTFVNFGQCGFEGNVGVILVNTTTSVVDTVWSPFIIPANSPSQNVLIALSGLSSGTSYLYKGILKSGGQYFTTNFQLSFTTEGIPNVVEPFFTNFFVAQEGLLATVFFGLDLADFTGSPDIKVRVNRNNSTQGGTQTIFDSPVSNSGNISFDHTLPGYGTHTFWCEVYHATLGTVYESTDNFIFTITGVVELEREVSEFDRVVVYNMSGQIVDAFERGQTVSIRNLPFGMYVLQGIVGEETVALSKALRQQ